MTDKIYIDLELITHFDYEENKRNYTLNITAGAIQLQIYLDAEDMMKLLQLKSNGSRLRLKGYFKEVVGVAKNFHIRERGDYICLTPETLNMIKENKE
jgi:hypothetical protein